MRNKTNNLKIKNQKNKKINPRNKGYKQSKKKKDFITNKYTSLIN